MTRKRRLWLHAFVAAGIGTLGFVFSQMSVGSSSPVVFEIAALASVMVSLAFAAKLIAIAGSRSQEATVVAPRAATRDWRAWGLGLWVTVCVAAFTSEVVAQGFGDPQRILPQVSTLLLVTILAIQAFRMLIAERAIPKP